MYPLLSPYCHCRFQNTTRGETSKNLLTTLHFPLSQAENSLHATACTPPQNKRVRRDQGNSDDRYCVNGLIIRVSIPNLQNQIG